MRAFLSALVLLLVALPAAADARINLVALEHFSESEKARVTQAAQLLEKTLNSPEFKNQVVATAFVQTEGLSSQEIYDKISTGTANFQLSIYSPHFWKRKSEVGHTSPGDPFIYLNRWYFTRFTVGEVAANLAHEWMHKLGFDHDYKRTARRPHSVPYAVGDIVEGLTDIK